LFDHALNPTNLASDPLHSPENFFLDLLVHHQYVYPVQVYVNKNLDARACSSQRSSTIGMTITIGMNPQCWIEIAGHWKKN